MNSKCRKEEGERVGGGGAKIKTPNLTATRRYVFQLLYHCLSCFILLSFAPRRGENPTPGTYIDGEKLFLLGTNHISRAGGRGGRGREWQGRGEGGWEGREKNCVETILPRHIVWLPPLVWLPS